MMIMTESRGFTLGALRESILKCKSDQSSARGRILRMTAEINEVEKRIIEQNNANANLEVELTSMKKRRDELDEDILKTNQYLDNLTKTNCDFIKEKVVNPAEVGIGVAHESIECLREIIDSSYKLNMLFKRENPEKADTGTQVNWCFPAKKPTGEKEKLLFADILRHERELFRKQDVLRDAKSIGRGNKSTKGNFVSISKADWDEKERHLDRLRKEEAALIAELETLEGRAAGDKCLPHEPQMNADGSFSVPVAMDTENGSGKSAPAVVVVQQESQWLPSAPHAVPVAEQDSDMSASFAHFDS